MKKHSNKPEELFLTCNVIANLEEKKLLLPKRTVENLHNLTCCSTKMYFQYKNKYPDFEEVIILDLKPIPLSV